MRAALLKSKGIKLKLRKKKCDCLFYKLEVRDFIGGVSMKGSGIDWIFKRRALSNSNMTHGLVQQFLSAVGSVFHKLLWVWKCGVVCCNFIWCCGISSPIWSSWSCWVGSNLHNYASGVAFYCSDFVVVGDIFLRFSQCRLFWC